MAPRAPDPPLALISAAIVSCQRCARLRSYCEDVARVKRAAYREEEYWGKPVPGFGDPRARMLILGLAPAAHGANRTGRVFTGDGNGGSGDFLMAALNRAGFANLTTSSHVNDGLQLKDAYIMAAVRCAPPQNKPLPEEIAACADHLEAELAALPRLEVVVALGKIAWDAWFQHLARGNVLVRPRPPFAHGARFMLRNVPNVPNVPGVPGVPRVPTVLGVGPRTSGTSGTLGTLLIGCYHPSRQNTNTGKVTAKMYDEIFEGVKESLRS